MSLPLLHRHALAQVLKRPRIQPPVINNDPRLPEWDDVPVTPPSLEVDASSSDDLESFVWVMLYALCVKEMNRSETSSSKDQYCKLYFMKIFGALSFNDTHDQHNAAREHILGNHPANEVWMGNHISDVNAWTVIRALMWKAKSNTLGYKEFKGILQHYITLLESPKPVSQTD